MAVKNKNSLSQIFSVDKATEGGIGQKGGMEMLKAAKIKCQRAHSPYVGQTGILVIGTQEDIDKADEILFGK